MKHSTDQSAYRNIYMDPLPLNIYILGNGFDLDLGMKTDYKSFANSDYWPFKTPKRDTLEYFLNEHRKIDTWFDLEELLFQYANKHKDWSFISIPNDWSKDNLYEYDKQSYRKLCKSLKNYISNELRETELDRDSTAAELLRNILFHNEYSKVYSFNYTDVNQIKGQVCFDDDRLNCSYVHGNLRGDIILGVGDQHELKDGYFFLHKFANHNLQSTNIIPDLERATSITFFGHSLGTNDNAYFSDFFQNATKQLSLNTPKRKITFFTKDEKSEEGIRKRLMELTSRQGTRLKEINELKIVKTCNPKEVENYFAN